jgi:ferredoxin-NADP reductase
VVLFYGNRDWDDVAFRDDLEQVKDRLNLIVVACLLFAAA